MKLEKHSENADLRQAAHLRVHARQESLKKKVQESDGNQEHHQKHLIKISSQFLELSC